MTNKLAVSQAMMQRMRRAIQREGLPFAGFRAHPDGSVTAVVGDPAQFARAPAEQMDPLDAELAEWDAKHGQA